MNMLTNDSPIIVHLSNREDGAGFEATILNSHYAPIELHVLSPSHGVWIEDAPPCGADFAPRQYGPVMLVPVGRVTVSFFLSGLFPKVTGRRNVSATFTYSDLSGQPQTIVAHGEVDFDLPSPADFREETRRRHKRGDFTVVEDVTIVSR